MSSLPRILLALGIGALGGTLFLLLHLPLPFMLGAILSTTLAALAGVPLVAPRRIRPGVVAVIGVLLGSGFGPDLVAKIPGLAVSLGFLALYLALSAALVIPFYRVIGRFDPVSAYFSAMPGGLTEMVLIGEEAGGDARKIILAHAARIFICVFLIAFWFRVILEVNVTQAPLSTGLASLSLKDGAILILAAFLGYRLAKVLRLPAPDLLGPMVLSAVAHLASWTSIAPPMVLVALAQIALGTMLGCRFVGTPPREVLRALGLALVATLITLACALGCAVLVAKVSGMDQNLVLLAYAPGGLSEMSLIALALKADVAFVAIQHLCRIVLVIALAPLFFRWVRR